METLNKKQPAKCSSFSKGLYTLIYKTEVQRRLCSKTVGEGRKMDFVWPPLAMIFSMSYLQYPFVLQMKLNWSISS